jgi:hypothetical protein
MECNSSRESVEGLAVFERGYRSLTLQHSLALQDQVGPKAARVYHGHGGEVEFP